MDATFRTLVTGIPMRLWRYGVPGVESFDSRHLTDEEVSDAP